MSPQPGEDLDFEHVGEFELDQDLLVADPQFMGSTFAEMIAGGVRMGRLVACRPGNWHALVVRNPQPGSQGAPDGIAFLLLCHESELANPAPLHDAEAISLIRIESGRCVAIAEDLRDEDDIQSAILEAAPQELPGTVVGRGVAVELGIRGNVTLFGSLGEPRTALFLSASEDGATPLHHA
jgi:hypothetical protein